MVQKSLSSNVSIVVNLMKLKIALFLILSIPLLVKAQNKDYYKFHPVFNDFDSLYTSDNSLETQFGSVFFVDRNKNIDLLSQPAVLYSRNYKKFRFNYYGAFNLFYADKNQLKKYEQTQTLVQFGRLQKLTHSFLWNFQHFFHLSYRPDSIFRFEIVRDAPKYGYGYNSLFLDDKHSPYTYALAAAKIWHLKYQFTLNFLRDKRADSTALPFRRKYMVNHLLSWNISKHINFNFFESVVWASVDSAGTRGIDVNYLNPVVFFRPVEFAIGSPDNAFLGLGLSVRLFKQFYLYSQVLLDEFVLSQVKAGTGWWGNKQAFQAGLRTESLFGIQNMSFLGELNLIRPFVYAHANNWRTYSHLHQSLGFVWGSNQAELLEKISYKYGRWQISNLSAVRRWAQDSVVSVSLGNNIFKSYELRSGDYDQRLFQGISAITYESLLKIGYLLFPKHNLIAFAGLHYQFIKRSTSKDNLLLTLGVFTKIGQHKYNIDNLLREIAN